MSPRLVIKQMGSGAILLRGAGLLAGDDECKLGLVQFELLEGLLRAGKCQSVDKARFLERGLCWRDSLGAQLYLVIELREDVLSLFHKAFSASSSCPHPVLALPPHRTC